MDVYVEKDVEMNHDANPTFNNDNDILSLSSYSDELLMVNEYMDDEEFSNEDDGEDNNLSHKLTYDAAEYLP